MIGLSILQVGFSNISIDPVQAPYEFLLTYAEVLNINMPLRPDLVNVINEYKRIKMDLSTDTTEEDQQDEENSDDQDDDEPGCRMK